MRGTTALLATLIVLGSSASASAQERLPPPRDAVPPAVTPPVPVPLPGPAQIMPGPGGMPPTGFYRTSAYEHWQYRSVGRDGRFHPRVLNTPEGYFYYYNGKPYPYGPPPTRFLGPPDTIGR